MFCAAYAHELKRYGIKHGLTNWAAAYATGLLIARRTLKKLELDDTFVGVDEADGEFKMTEAAEPTKELDAETLRKYIFGGHVAEYMESLADDDEERYKSQFQQYIDDEVEADGLEDLYTEAHKAIREDPFKVDDDAGEKKGKEEWKEESKKYRQKKLSKAEKDARVKTNIDEAVKKVKAERDD